MIETWADDLDILGGLGEDTGADWTVLTLERGQPSDSAAEAADLAGPRADPEPRAAFASAASPSPDPARLAVDAEPAPPRELRPARREPRPARPAEPERAPLRAVEPEPAPPHAVEPVPEPEPSRSAAGGRRTVVIRGQAAPLRAVVSSDRRRPAQRPRDRVRSNPDRIAMWAVGLGVLLILIAVITAGG